MGHTSGPWDFAGGDMTVHANRLALEICRQIGGHMEPYSTEQEDERIANANLLQAAPCLLDALKAVMAITEGGDGDMFGLPLHHAVVFDRAASVIRKAEGRTE